MLQLVAYLLNTVLIATGVFQYFKLEWCWAGLGVCIGAANLLVLYFRWTTGVIAALAAVGCLIAIAQGAILGYQAAKTFIDKGLPTGDTGMWDLIFSGHDFSYALVYVGAGLSMLVLLVQERNSELQAPNSKQAPSVKEKKGRGS